jgi:hypothetical protein
VGRCEKNDVEKLGSEDVGKLEGGKDIKGIVDVWLAFPWYSVLFRGKKNLSIPSWQNTSPRACPVKFR